MPLVPGTRVPYQRGVVDLPGLPEWEANSRVVTLVPAGENSFVYKEGYKVRTYSSILGCIVRKHWPGFVTMPNGCKEVAWIWSHYAHAPDPEATHTRRLKNCQSRVIREFWTYFTMDPDSKRDDCIQVAGNIARKKVTDAHYEGSVLSICNWYAEKRKLRMRKDQAREIVNFQPWQYLQCPPPYVGHARPQVWHAMVRHYTSTVYKRKHEEQKLKRAKMGGGSHTQGSVPLAVCKQKKEKETGVKSSLFKIWGDQRKKTDKKYGTVKWVSKIAEVKDKKYRSKFAQTHGDEANPETEPFDPEVAMRAGEGEKHGRLFVCDGAVDPKTIPSLRQIKGGNTSSSPAVEPRPTPSSIAIDPIRAELEAEKAQREKAEALLTQNQQQMAMQQQMMLWMTRKLSAHDAHLSASMPSGTTLPTDPPPFDINAWLHASGGSNNIELHGPSTQDGNDNLMTPPTGGQPSFNNLGIVRRL
ncbi:autonomous transposable element EN-1 mosaic protein [Lolium perenne]|uniref:autonomous transposable element EN-1 mosaic protein n=1 Tax=Lolium perenne TaxID=4522 RepID=UPI0021F663C0|nr:uncharacterized protein LOC127344777 [Lolium perenne]